jgi:isoleucyl-tRNA synthetase
MANENNEKPFLSSSPVVKSETSKNEERILDFWQKNKIFEKSLKIRKNAKRFVFYEGPPTANGRPGIHHVETRSFKDLFCRYKTMRGFLVERKAGWDTHGLPVELEVEKQLKFSNKSQIEEYGIGKFNQKCKESVWQYKEEWENLTKRMGYWLDLKNPYITYENSYIESIWNILKNAWDKKILYEGFKIVPFCPRCSTTLSSHELALGYKMTKDPSVFVRFELQNEPQNYILVWTTTPWTLPANTAIAINEKEKYAKIKLGDSFYYVGEKLKEKLANFKGAKNFSPEFIQALFAPHESVLGKNLVGKKYRPLFDFEYIKDEQKKNSNSWKIYSADFVSLEDGTGFVHIAPAYGEDDLTLAQKFGISILQTVDLNGRFVAAVNLWKNMFVKDADKYIFDYLSESGQLWAGDLSGIEHEYPFCWRCQTPLLYMAKSSWFIKMSQFRNNLLANNRKINWTPKHLQEGRFGQWLQEVKDWALSRERYWGTPLPVWKCLECGEKEIVGSISDISQRTKSNNHYWFLRHGEAENNKKDINNAWPEKKKFSLTPLGRKQAELSAKKLIKEKIDLIISSPILRTLQTAQIASKILGVKKIIIEKNLREIDLGVLNGKPNKDYHAQFANEYEHHFKKIKGGESVDDLQRRMAQLLMKLEKKYQGKKILLVSHQYPIWMSEAWSKQLWGVSSNKLSKVKYGEIKKINVPNLPYDQYGKLDLHKPYIDEIKFICKKCGGKMQRYSEVIDVWFDSGAMPFAQFHYPFENKKIFDGGKIFPADFICEAIDQTRGWFYTLLAISTFMQKGTPYKNVISLGHVLDEKGQKMSKSKGNVVSPWNMIDKYGSDSVRWYFYTVNQAGEPKLFAEKDLARSLGVLQTFNNVVNFFELYIVPQLKNKKLSLKLPAKLTTVDEWILTRLDETILKVSDDMDSYSAVDAARHLQSFIDDLSRWYLRRTRSLLQQPESQESFLASAQVLGFLIYNTTRLLAPFAPFLSEKIWQETILKSFSGIKVQSVHLENYPVSRVAKINSDIISNMEVVRNLANIILKLRAQAGKKVRQPLGVVYVLEEIKGLDNDMLKVLKDETNIKEIKFKADQINFDDQNFVKYEEVGLKVFLDTTITPQLFFEGMVREFIRNIQEARKELNLKPQDKIEIFIETSEKSDLRDRALIEELKKFSNIKPYLGYKKQNYLLEKEFEIEGINFLVGLKKVK